MKRILIALVMLVIFASMIFVLTFLNYAWVQLAGFLLGIAMMCGLTLVNYFIPDKEN